MGFWWSGLGLMGFVCRGSWVCLFCSPLYPPPPSLPLMVRLLSLKFRFFAVGCGCHGGASGGSSLWVFGGPVWV